MLVKSYFTNKLWLLAALLLLASCTTSTNNRSGTDGRYSMKHDSPELEPINLASIQAVVPVAEPRTIAGNKSPYTINGETYYVLSSEQGYSASGMASWYGRKFHGHHTSNGEVYDMFQLSAAHKTLPIPSYIRVTNLENMKTVVVRVNDRGPFHAGREVDLSYAAAVMLGYADKGTARVRVEAITPPGQETLEGNAYTLVDPFPRVETVETLAMQREKIQRGEDQEYIQVAAFSQRSNAELLLAQLSDITTLPIFIHEEPGSAGILHRVRLGPVNETMDIQGLMQMIVEHDLGRPFMVRQ